MTDVNVSQEAIEKAKLNQETAMIPWADLQKHFARGVVYQVDASLDLVDVGYQLFIDNKQQVKSWLEQDLFKPVPDETAALWHEQQTNLWALVIQPWVIVQNK